MFDCIIRGAKLVDGTGSPAYPADLAIQGEQIVAIGNLEKTSATEIVEANGALLCPGFIDAHTHSDTFILIEPYAPSKLTQGATTEVCGNCGSSAAPRFSHTRLPSDWEAISYPQSWQSIAEYRTALSLAKPATNVILFVGHNTLRKGVCRDAPRASTPEELALMSQRLEQALDEGAWGLSTGLVYHPGIHATPEEVLQLAQTTARCGGHYATHMRSEGEHLLEAIEEVLSLGRQTGIPLQISHLKTAGATNWHKIDTLLEVLNSARDREGLWLYSDRYPYLAAGTDLDIVLPEWATAGGRDAILRNLADPASRRRIIDELNCSARDWATIQLGGTWSSCTQHYAGRYLTDILAGSNHFSSIGELVATIIEADETRTSAFFFGMSEENLNKILRQPWIMPGSDASLRSPTGILAKDYPHPRAYGTMPEYFHRLRRFATLEETIHRMTALPAKAFNIPNRGIIREGYAADLVLLDENSYRAKATYDNPRQYSEGVLDVWVNGGHVLSKGKFLDNRKGRFLARNERP